MRGRPRTRATALLLAAAVAVSVAASGLSPTAVNATPKATDRADASYASLRLSDFPGGWSVAAPATVSGVNAALAACLHVPTDVLDNPASVTVSSPTYAGPTNTSALSGVSYDPTAAMARSQFMRVVANRLAPGCYADQLRAGAPRQLPPGSKITSVTCRALAFPHVGNASAALRSTLDVRVSGKNLTTVIDQITFIKGRASETLLVQQPGGPPAASLETKLAGEVLRRLRNT
jgi:hypothetical protein